jgi:hypothetical protein
VKIIRGRLSAADVSNPTIRYNPDTDQIEMTPDGGVTWNPAPGSDPRHSMAFLKPPVAGSSKQCDAAANMVKWLHDFIDQMLFDFELVGSVTTIINSILLSLNVLSAGFATFLEVISELAETISGIGAVGLTAAFTDDQYDLLICIFFCHAGADGRVTALQLAAMESDITAQLNTTAALVVNAILFLQGEIGLSNAGAIGSETGECDDCGCAWCYNFQDVSRLSEWIPETVGTATATYSGGVWNSAVNGDTAWLWISWTLGTPTVLIDAAILAYTPDGRSRAIYLNGDGSGFSGTLVWQDGFIVGTPFPITTSRIDMYIVHAHDAGPGTLGEAQFSGQGDPPFGDSNC